MMNHKQAELANDFFQTVKAKFPEVDLIKISPSPEDPREIWINITAPPEENREFELMDLVSERSADILLEYGYAILVIPNRN